MKSLAPKKGFTFLEAIVSVAIIGILATISIVYSTNYLKRARAAKALTLMSSAVLDMAKCQGNMGTINNPASGTYICKINGTDSPTYGLWPNAGSEDLGEYSYNEIGIVNKDDWHFALEKASDRRVCCNSKMNKCKMQYWVTSTSAWEANCDSSVPSS